MDKKIACNGNSQDRRKDEQAMLLGWQAAGKGLPLDNTNGPDWREGWLLRKADLAFKFHPDCYRFLQ